jgi:endonuclease/exonuclease/phosphatase family metal-dependent hydrolase
VQAPRGALRITTTHLEYYSEAQRRAQAGALRAIHAEACGRAALEPRWENEESNVTFDPTPQAADAILTGDFNFPPENPAYAQVQEPLEGGAPGYRDAWALVHGRKPHAPTFCLHERNYGGAPYCCDFVFVSETLARRVRSIEANLDTRDSDHQPLLAEIDDS